MRFDFTSSFNLLSKFLIVIGTFWIAANLSIIAKNDNQINKRKNDCADVVSGAMQFNYFIKKYNIGENDEKIIDYPITALANNFCRFYSNGGFGDV
tara:strand:- start:261 stop:548 length:288 start_codon:yes stop_codon:yes gene_type:complete